MLYIVFGMVQLLVGVYGLASVLKMKNRGDLSGGFLPSKCSRSNCKDPNGLIHFLLLKQLFFSVFCGVSGVLNILNGQKGILDENGVTVTLGLAFLLMTLAFAGIVRRAVQVFFE